MLRLIHSLAFKVGAIIILAEVVVLTLLGYIYIGRFAAEIDRRVETQVRLPGALMQAGLLNINAVTDRQTMMKIIGGDIIEGMVVGMNKNIFYSLNPEQIGQQVDKVVGAKKISFDIDNPQGAVTYEKRHVMSVTPIFLPDQRTPQFIVYVKIDASNVEAEKNQIYRLFLLGSLIAVICTSAIIIISFNRTVVSRIRKIVGVLEQVERGDLSVRTEEAESADEIKSLQHGVNTMAGRLESLFDNLEQRVADRTRDLGIAADVSKQITTVLDIDELLQQVATLTVKGFNLYSAFVYLLDESGKRLLRAAGADSASDVSSREFVKEISIDADQSIIALAARRNEVVTINDVKNSPQFLPSNGLKEARSELAIPMRLGKRLLGVFDLQSDQINRFGEDDIRVLTSLGEQTAIAVHNARLFAEVQAVRQAAVAANEEKSKFLANMSHELRTPLNSIFGYTQILKREKNLNHRQETGLNVIKQSGEYLLGLINDILDLSKIEAGKLELLPQVVDLPSLLWDVTELIRVKVEEKHLRFEYQNSANLPQAVWADEKRLSQVLLNLLGNAIKFTEQGTIRLRVQLLSSANGEAKVRFEISDTGVGIPAEELSKLFQPFAQVGDLKQRIAGTGLGLSISRRLVRLMGSDIHVESTPGRGSIFSFEVFFPVSEQLANKSLEQTLVGYEGVRRKILIVDDVLANREMLVELLNDVGFQTFVASNGQEGVEQAREVQPDLIAMDMMMPVMNGLEASRRIRQISGLERTPILAISASASIGDREEFLAAGATSFVAKPVEHKILLDEIGVLLKLNWVIGQPSDVTDDHDDASALIAPPENELEVLYELARTGNMRDIGEWATNIATIDKKFQPFADKLRQLAREFDSEAILALAEKYLRRE